MKTIKLINDIINLPDGVYPGEWAGYVIKLPGYPKSLETAEGCKSISHRVTVTVRGGRAVATE